MSNAFEYKNSKNDFRKEKNRENESKANFLKAIRFANECYLLIVCFCS